MSTEHREKVQIISDGDFEQSRRVVEHSPSGRNVFISRLNQIIWLLASAIVALIGFRFALMLANANPTQGFANFVYVLTAPFVYPFQNILVNPTTNTGSVIEVTKLSQSSYTPSNDVLCRGPEAQRLAYAPVPFVLMDTLLPTGMT